MLLICNEIILITIIAALNNGTIIHEMALSEIQVKVIVYGVQRYGNKMYFIYMVDYIYSMTINKTCINLLMI